MLATVTATKPKHTKPKTKPREEPAGRKRSIFTRVGDEAKADAQRKLLLATLKAHDWNLRATGEALEMGTGAGATVAVGRALQELAPEEYEEAKADGRIASGRRGEE